MSNRKFEAHITIDKAYAERLKEGLKGWQYSAIDNDPVMGQKPYCYLTQYAQDAKVLLTDMRMVEDILVNEMNIPVLRLKIEEILFDTKTGHDRINKHNQTGPVMATEDDELIEGVEW